MKPRVEMALCATAIGYVAGALSLASWQPAEPAGARQAAAGRVASVRDDKGMRIAAAEIVDSDPFRLDRSPSPVAFVPNAQQVAAAAPPPPPATPKPRLVVRAVVGGPPWQALIDGIPGKSAATLVNAGDRVADLIIVTINKDLVIVQGMDTTWRLGVARPWQ